MAAAAVFCLGIGALSGKGTAGKDKISETPYDGLH